MNLTGIIVLYNIAEGIVRPAIVVACNEKTKEEPESINLQVFIDGNNDRIGGPIYDTGISNRECNTGLIWRTKVFEGNKKGQWQPLTGE